MTVQGVTRTLGAGRSDAPDSLFVRRVADTAEVGASSRLPAALLAYAAAVALLTSLPPFLKAPVGSPRAFTLQEPTDLLTSLVAMPLAWLVCDLEGTAALGIPALIALLGWSALVRRRRAGNPAVLTFVLVVSVVTLVGYLGWAALHHGTLPGFYDVGLVQ